MLDAPRPIKRPGILFPAMPAAQAVIQRVGMVTVEGPCGRYGSANLAGVESTGRSFASRVGNDLPFPGAQVIMTQPDHWMSRSLPM